MNENICYLDVCRFNTSEEYINNIAVHILLVITKGLFIVVLEDTSGRYTHTIGINSGLKAI